MKDLQCVMKPKPKMILKSQTIEIECQAWELTGVSRTKGGRRRPNGIKLTILKPIKLKSALNSTNEC